MDLTSKTRASRVTKPEKQKPRSDRTKASIKTSIEVRTTRQSTASGGKKSDEEALGSDSQGSQTGQIVLSNSTAANTPANLSPSLKSLVASEGESPHGSSNADVPESPLSVDEMRLAMPSVGGLDPNVAQERTIQDVEMAETSERTTERTSRPRLGRMEFIVPLPLQGQAVDQYKRTIAYHKDLVKAFTSHAWATDSKTYQETVAFVALMRDIATHIDLTNTTIGDAEVGPWEQAEWDKTASSKFKFVFELLDFCRNHAMHFVLLAKSDKLRDMLEKFLTGSKVKWQRPDADRKADANNFVGNVSVTLLPSTSPGANAAFLLASTHAIISFDQDIDTDAPYINRLRQSSSWGKSLVPVIYLTVRNSVDHIERCLSPAMSAIERLGVLVYCVTELRKCAGKMSVGFGSIKEHAEEAGRFIAMRPDDAEGLWPLPPIGEVDDEQAWALVRAEVPLKSVLSSSQELLGGSKRLLERVLEAENDTKKMRMTPQEDQDKSTSLITDSAAGSSIAARTDEELQALRGRLSRT